MAFSSQVSRLAREAPRPKLAKEDKDYQSVYKAVETFQEIHKLPDYAAQAFKMY